MGQSGSSEQARSPFDGADPAPTASVPPSTAAPERVTLIPTVLQWSHGGRMVYVTGTFNNWAERIPMRLSRNDFTVCLNLPVGTFQYKFIVDNEWRFSPSQPLVQDAQGNVNNCITVLDEEDFMRENIGPASDPNDGPFSNDPTLAQYGQSLADDAIQLAKDPPPLPTQLTRVVLNSEVSTAPPTMVDELPPPLPCTLLHLCWQQPAQPEGSGVAQAIVVASSQRYRAKYVSLVLYKPPRLRGAGTRLVPKEGTASVDTISSTRAADALTAAAGDRSQSSSIVASALSAPRPPSLMQIDDDGGASSASGGVPLNQMIE